MYLKIYVPAANSPVAETVKKGSAIVGLVIENKVLIFYEGNLYGAANMQTIKERLIVAASRLNHYYPTVAKMIVDADQLINVGTFDTATQEIRITNAEAMDTWRGDVPLF